MDANTKEAYQLYSYKHDTHEEKTAVGARVNIPKDMSLKEAYLGTTDDTVNKTTGVVTKVTPTETTTDSLNFVYILGDGTYSLVPIDIELYLKESEFSTDDFVISGHNVSLTRDVVKGLTVNGVAATMADGASNDHKLTVTINGTNILVDANSEETDTIANKLEELVAKFDPENGAVCLVMV